MRGGHIRILKALLTDSGVGSTLVCFGQAKGFTGRMLSSRGAHASPVPGDMDAHHGAFGLRKKVQKPCSHQFCLVKSHWFQMLIWRGDWEESMFQDRFRKVWKYTLLSCKLASENDECYIENNQSQQQDNLSSVVLKSLSSVSLRASCHFEDHGASQVSLPFLTHQSAPVGPGVAARSVLDPQGVQPFPGGL